MERPQANEFLQMMKGRQFKIEGETETVQSFSIHPTASRVLITTNVKTRETTLNELDEHLKIYVLKKTSATPTAKPTSLIKAIDYLSVPGNYLEETELKQLYAHQHGGKTGSAFHQWKKDYNIKSDTVDGKLVYAMHRVQVNEPSQKVISQPKINKLPMKLKEFNPENTLKTRSGLPTINFVSGCITFSPQAVDLLQLKAEDGIKFFNDENEPHDWYVGKHPEGFKLRLKTAGQNYLVFNSVGIKQQMFKTLNCKKTNHTFLISEKGQVTGAKGAEVKIFSIVTGSAINKGD